MAKKRYDKDALFNDYLLALWQAMEHIERTFEVQGISEQVLGERPPEEGRSGTYDLALLSANARSHVEHSKSWGILSGLYDYAVDGLLSDGDFAEDLVLYGKEILSVLIVEDSSPCQEWFDIVLMGDTRFGLHGGGQFLPESLAMLANVDVRTVRNAISAGDLDARKVMGDLWIEHDSALRWLQRRRGFKPTRIINMRGVDLKEIASPLVMAAFLKERREKLKLNDHRDTLPPAHPATNDQTLKNLEDGIFTLTLDAAFPLADFYQLERIDFLKALMRCFYPEQYKALTENI